MTAAEPGPSVRALSVARPWAGLIIGGHKEVENRTWTTRYRGLFVIHASQRFDRPATWLAQASGLSTEPAGHPTGYLGTVQLADIHHDRDCDATCSGWAEPGCWHWQLTNPQPFPAPVPGPGRLALYSPPPEITRLITAHARAGSPTGGHPRD